MAVVSFWSVAVGQQSRPTPSTNSFSSDVTNSDVIAIVTVGAGVRVPSKSATGAMISLRATEAKLERAIKGNPPANFQIRESEKPNAHFPVEEVTRTGSGTVHTGTSRWLVFLKQTGDSYSAVDAQSLCSVYGTGPGSRVIWRMACLSMEETEEMIKKLSAQK